MKKYDRFGRSIKAHHNRHPETGITPDYRDPDLAFKNAIQSGVFHETPNKKSYNFVGNWMYMHSEIFKHPYAECIIDQFKNIETRKYIQVKVL